MIPRCLPSEWPVTRTLIQDFRYRVTFGMVGNVSLVHIAIQVAYVGHHMKILD
jgi:hypothetical protein